MRGTRSIVGFGVLAIAALVFAWYINDHPGFGWCSDKPAGCDSTIAPDLGYLLGLIGLGLFALLAIVLAGNFLFKIFRSRRQSG
jgi:hypothetical protein